MAFPGIKCILLVLLVSFKTIVLICDFCFNIAFQIESIVYCLLESLCIIAHTNYNFSAASYKGSIGKALQTKNTFPRKISGLWNGWPCLSQDQMFKRSKSQVPKSFLQFQ